VDVEVVEKGSSGILGLFNKPAVIRVRRKKDKDILEEDVATSISIALKRSERKFLILDSTSSLVISGFFSVAGATAGSSFFASSWNL